jgi:pantoate--beta-alanine ligase
MRVIKKLDEMIQTARGWLTRGSVGLVSITNGQTLHAGHRALLQAAREHCEISVVCLLRSSLLFDASSDEPAPIRNLEADLQYLDGSDVDVVFAPQYEELFPPDFATYIDIDGPMRASLLRFHDDPVALREFATTFSQILLIIRPDVIFLGRKDPQQAAIIHKIIHDLHIDVSLHIISTVREKNGLAMSSRNASLCMQERECAAHLYQSLLHYKQCVEQGEYNSWRLCQIVREELARVPAIELLDQAICDPITLLPREQVKPGTLFSLKARIGSHYFIDSIQWSYTKSWLL